MSKPREIYVLSHGKEVLSVHRTFAEAAHAATPSEPITRWTATMDGERWLAYPISESLKITRRVLAPKP